MKTDESWIEALAESITHAKQLAAVEKAKQESATAIERHQEQRRRAAGTPNFSGCLLSD